MFQIMTIENKKTTITLRLTLTTLLLKHNFKPPNMYLYDRMKTISKILKNNFFHHKVSQQKEVTPRLK